MPDMSLRPPPKTKGAAAKRAIMASRNFKASLRAVYEEIFTTEKALVREGVLRGLKAAPPHSAPYYRLAAELLDRLEKVETRPVEVKIVQSFSPDPTS